MKTFVHPEGAFTELGGGTRRRIGCYNGQMMLVEVNFDASAVGNDHSHPHTQISYVLEGAFTYHIEGVAHHIQRASSMLSVRFAEGEGRDFADMKAADTFRFAPFFHALLDHGVYAPASAFETWFVSTALTDEDFEVIEAALRPAAQAAAAATADN